MSYSSKCRFYGYLHGIRNHSTRQNCLNLYILQFCRCRHRTFASLHCQLEPRELFLTIFEQNAFAVQLAGLLGQFLTEMDQLFSLIWSLLNLGPVLMSQKRFKVSLVLHFSIKTLGSWLTTDTEISILRITTETYSYQLVLNI